MKSVSRWQTKGVSKIKIKEIRTDVLKKTQQEMADALGITKSAYCRKESGGRAWKWQEIVKICTSADIDPRLVEG